MSATPGTLKRKHSEKTIKDLFTTQSKPHATSAVPLSPTKKRSRRASSPIATPDATTTATMSTADMYHFPSKRADIPGTADIVDISSSPDTSPAKRNARKVAAPNMHAPAGPKRLLVKNFKPTRKVDPKAFLDQTWAKIDVALDTIFAQGTVDFSLEEMYRGVENVCRQGMARDVRERLVAKCRVYVGGTLKEGVKESVGRGNVEVLRAVLGAWGVWGEQVVSFYGVCDVCCVLILGRNTWIGSFVISIARIYFLGTNRSARSRWIYSARLYSRTRSSIRASWMARAISLRRIGRAES